MRTLKPLPRLRALVVPGLLLLAGLAAGPAQAAHFNWLGATGSVDDPTKWNPAAIPGAADHFRFETATTYTATFPAGVPNSLMLVVGQGNPSWLFAGPHTTGGMNVQLPSNAHTLTLKGGLVTTDYLHLGGFGMLSIVTLTNNGPTTTGVWMHSKGINNPQAPSFGDHIGHDGISELNIFGGSRYYADQVGSSWPFEIATLSSAAATVTVAGFSTVPTRYSQLIVGTNGMTVGAAGTANLFATNGGNITCAGPVMIGRSVTSNGYVNIGPVASLGTSFLNAQDVLRIGHNGFGPEAGHGELTVNDRAWVTAAGLTYIGDPDNVVDKQSFLRVRQGGTFTANGGIRVHPTSGTPLDLQGGVTRVAGGQLEWPAGKSLAVGSTTGTPELWISNGGTNVAPSTSSALAQLRVGNTGTGRMFVTGAGTVFPMGAGSTIVADVAGTTGLLEVDDGAVLSSGGALHVGNAGSGTLNVLDGSLVDVGFLQVGVAAGGFGDVVARGAGSILRTRNNVWIGGNFGGAGGAGNLAVEDNAVLEVLQTGVNPALVTVYAGTGQLFLRSGGRLATGTLDCRGTTWLEGGTAEATTVLVPPGGTVEGYGVLDLATGMFSSGALEPHAAPDILGTIVVDGSATLNASSAYGADLGAGGPGGSDLLVVTGAATLGGTLALRTTPAFTGTPGTVFTVLTCGSRVGTFAAVTWNGAPLAGQANVLYEADAVRIVIPSSTGVQPIPAAGPSALRFAASGARDRLEFALELPAAAQVEAVLYDVRGRAVGDLFAGSLGAGRHVLAPRDAAGVTASGAYFARAVIRADGETTVRTARAVLVR